MQKREVLVLVKQEGLLLTAARAPREARGLGRTSRSAAAEGQ